MLAERVAAPLLICLWLVVDHSRTAVAQQVANGGPSFVSNAQAVQDLDATDPLDPANIAAGADGIFGAETDGEISFGLHPEAASGDLERFKYQGTAIASYDPNPIPSWGAMGLGCGFGYVDPTFQGAYIGVGLTAFSKGFACGRCVEIQCDDRACLEVGSSLVATVVDLCGDCYNADISLAIPAFVNFTGFASTSNPVLQVSWDYVDCTPFIDGTIKMLVKRGGTAYFQSFNFANSRVPITAVQINGDRLTHGGSSWWQWSPGKAIDPRGPFNIGLLGANREVLRMTATRLASQDLRVQFRGQPEGAL